MVTSNGYNQFGRWVTLDFNLMVTDRSVPNPLEAQSAASTDPPIATELFNGGSPLEETPNGGTVSLSE